jgi:hypothetical protein
MDDFPDINEDGVSKECQLYRAIFGDHITDEMLRKDKEYKVEQKKRDAAECRRINKLLKLLK